MTNKELLNTLKLCLQQRLGQKDTYQPEEILSAIDAIIDQMTAPTRSVPDVVLRFWQQEFCDDHGVPFPHKLTGYHCQPLRSVYEMFVAWHIRLYGKSPELSLKVFGGAQGAFLHVAGKYFKYVRTNIARIIVLRSLPGLF